MTSAATGPRNYTVGTERALFRMAEGTCYFPGCATPVISIEGGHHLIGVEIAHIRGAKPGSARYDPNMTDAERAAYANLILLCVPHHKLVDRVEPEKYPAEMLAEWKVSNEGADSVESLRAVATDVNLTDLIEEVAARLTPIRKVSVELVAGLFTGDGATTSPIDQMVAILRLNPQLHAMPRVLVANVRNTGTAAVSLEAVDLHYEVDAPESRGSAEFTLLGRNDFLMQNPALPYRLLDGDALHWYTKVETVLDVVRAAAPRKILSVQVRVRLATGEEVRSAAEPWTGEFGEVA